MKSKIKETLIYDLLAAKAQRTQTEATKVKQKNLCVLCVFAANDVIQTFLKYTDESMGRRRGIDDFLPRPDEFVFKEDNVKVTIALSKSCVDFFIGVVFVLTKNIGHQTLLRREVIYE